MGCEDIDFIMSIVGISYEIVIGKFMFEQDGVNGGDDRFHDQKFWLFKSELLMYFLCKSS
jgi:hypothetical protein